MSLTCKVSTNLSTSLVFAPSHLKQQWQHNITFWEHRLQPKVSDS